MTVKVGRNDAVLGDNKAGSPTALSSQTVNAFDDHHGGLDQFGNLKSSASRLAKSSSESVVELSSLPMPDPARSMPIQKMAKRKKGRSRYIGTISYINRDCPLKVKFRPPHIMVAKEVIPTLDQLLRRPFIDPCNEKLSRRQFLGASSSAFAFQFLPSRVWGANERINVAGIGVGGKGTAGVAAPHKAGSNIVALCGADSARGAKSIKAFSKAKVYSDFEMLDKQKDIDAVTIAPLITFMPWPPWPPWTWASTSTVRSP